AFMAANHHLQLRTITRPRQRSSRMLESSRLRWEALPKGQQQPGRPLEAQSPAQQAPEQASFFGQEAEPPPAVRGHAQGGAPDVPLADAHRLVADDNGGLLVFIPAEGEVEGGVQPLGSVSLKDQGQAPQEAPNRSWPEAVPDPLGALVDEAAGDMCLGVRAGDDVHGLFLLLQGPDG